LEIVEKINLLGSSEADLEKLMRSLGFEKYKGRQLFKWLYGSLQSNFEMMSDLSRELRSKLIENYTFDDLKLVESRKSRDGTEKLLFQLEDGIPIETVLIPERTKKAICVSSQAGCALKCNFCATGQIGFKRNLKVGEIIGQLLFVRKKYGPDAFQNIVFMGMGEPLLNYSNVVKTVDIISSSIGLSLSARKVTISTAGIVPGIYRLADSGLKVNLAISLNSAIEEKRNQLMPVARKYGLAKLKEAARYYAKKKKKRITFEYILFDGINDTTKDALTLARLVEGIPCKINILSYNSVDGLSYRKPSEGRINDFAKYLYPRTPAVTVRKSRGEDIKAACGQLAGEKYGS
jgi:23S rRNA (adenine2503-C2)-methyltransferase